MADGEYAAHGASEPFLVAPHFQRKRAARRFCRVDDRAGQAPTAPLVEPGGAIVADRTSEPCRLDTVLGESCLRVRNQRRSDPRAVSLWRHEKLSQLITLEDVEIALGTDREHAVLQASYEGMNTPVPNAIVETLRKRIQCFGAGRDMEGWSCHLASRPSMRVCQKAAWRSGRYTKWRVAVTARPTVLPLHSLPQGSQHGRGCVLWSVTRRDLFVPALAQVGVAPGTVIYVEAGDEKDVTRPASKKPFATGSSVQSSRKLPASR